MIAGLQDWKQTLWNDIKTDQMEEGTKNFVKEVKALPKRVRGTSRPLCRHTPTCVALFLLSHRLPFLLMLLGKTSDVLCVLVWFPYLQVRDEDVFKGLENMVKNFLVSMPLVADLRSPAMRPRHWQQLLDTTKVGSNASA